MGKCKKIDIRGEWYCGDPFAETLTSDMLPAVDLVRKIEQKIKSLRSLYYEFVIVDLQRRGNVDAEFPLYFQTLRNRDYLKTNTYLVRLDIMKEHEFISYSKNTLTLDEVIDLFRKYCVNREKPDASEWKVETQMLYEEETSTRGTDSANDCERYKKFVSKCWQKKIEGIGVDFAEYEALEYITQNDYGPDYLCELAREYEAHGLYKKLDGLFDERSYNPVVAQIKGEMELNGIFGQPDYKKAFEYFTHAMSIGSILAEYNLAKMYKYGLYVKKNHAKYVRMLRSIYRKYNANLIEACPRSIILEMSKVEQQCGNEQAAIECCLQALNTQRMLMRCGLGNVTSEDADIVQQLYELVEFDPDDMDLLDLLYVLQQPNRVRIMLNGRQIEVSAYYNNDRLIVECDNKFYRDAVDFLRRHKTGDELLSNQTSKIDYMEIM